MPVLADGTIVDEQGKPTGQTVDIQSGQILNTQAPQTVQPIPNQQQPLAPLGTSTVTAPLGSSERTQQLLEASKRLLAQRQTSQIAPGAPQGAPGAVSGQEGTQIAPQPISDETGAILRDAEVKSLTQNLLTLPSIEDVIKQVATSFGLDDVKKQITDIDVSHAEEVAEINNNPWMSQQIRDLKIKKLEAKKDAKKDSLIEQLKFQQDIVGKAITVFQAEREYKKDLLFKELDLREKEAQREFESQTEIFKAFTKKPDQPASFEEFQLAQRNPEFARFLEQRRITPSFLLQSGQIDRPLTPNEAADFGVPFGTRTSDVQGVIPLGTTERKGLVSKTAALATLGQIESISKKVNTFGPGFLGLNRLIQGGNLTLGALSQTNPDAAQLVAQRGILATVIRGLGETGTLATQDVDRALALIPGLTTTRDVAQANLKEIRTILQAAKESVITGAQFQLRPQGNAAFSGTSPSGLKYKIK